MPKEKRQFKEVNAKQSFPDMEKEILEFPFTKIARKYGVTDNSVRKWCRYYGISPSPFRRGHWLKKQVEKI